MPRPPTGNRKYQIEHLWDHHLEIARLILLGLSVTEISERIGVSKDHISTIRNSEIFQDRIAVLQAARDVDSIDVSQQIQKLAPVAIDRIREVLDDPISQTTVDPALIIRTSHDVLDRAGYGAIKKSQSLIGHLTAEDIENMKKRAQDAGVVVDDDSTESGGGNGETEE